MLDEICEFSAKYHLVGWGLSTLALVFLTIIFGRRAFGKWRWEK